MNTILVPTDFSETANYALEVAVQLVKKHDSKLIVLHMLEIPLHILPEVDLSYDVQLVQPDHQSDLPQALFYMKLAQKRFAEIAELPFLKGMDYEEAIQNHMDFKGIINSAHKYNADLIVMGSHGTSTFKEMFVGSNTEKVVRTSDIPVLIIKTKNENFNVKNFVFAINWEDNNTHAIIEVNKFSKTLDTKLTLLYINTPGHYLTTKEINDEFESLFKDSDIKANNVITAVYSDKTIEKAILNFCEENHVDLIGLATHGKRGLSHFLNQSITEDVVNHSGIPVVTFKLDRD
ncbi:MAG: universal stress protein [Gelidibacter sp.]